MEKHVNLLMEGVDAETALRQVLTAKAAFGDGSYRNTNPKRSQGPKRPTDEAR